VIIGTVLKLSVLRHSTYRHLYIFSILHATLSTFVEISIFSFILLFWTFYSSGFQSIDSQYIQSYVRLSLSILFPEVFRVIAVMLHIFDAEPGLLVLLSCLIFSMQWQSYVTCTNQRWEALVPGLVVATVARFLWQHVVYRGDELWELGVFT